MSKKDTVVRLEPEEMLGYYLNELAGYFGVKPPGRNQLQVLLKVLENGLASAAMINQDLRNTDHEMSTRLIRRYLADTFKKGLVEKLEIRKPYREYFYELTTTGIHSLLISATVDDLEKVMGYYHENAIFDLFLYPFFEERTLTHPPQKLKDILISDYLPRLCGAMGSTVELVKKQNVRLDGENLHLIMQNAVAPTIGTEFIYLMFLIDKDTMRFLKQDRIFMHAIRFVMKLAVKRYKEMTEGKAASA